MRTFRLLLPGVLSLLATVIAVPGALIARDLGNLTEFSIYRNEVTGNEVTMKSSTGAIVQISVLRPDLFRIQVGPDGKLVPEGSKLAPIVIESTFTPVEAHISKGSDHASISTPAFELRITYSPLQFALYKPDGKTVFWKELKPIYLEAEGSYQTLSSDAGERFFGGGQQNGSFEFKGKVMEVGYSGGWEEGDRPNPAPFYMSSKGYGVLRNTWSDGTYDFWSDDYLTTRHKENRFDAYYFVGESVNHVLDLYTQLTGRASLLPRWGYEFGDADCYNDHDNRDKPGTVPEGWSDGPTGTTPDVIATVAAKYREHDMPGGWILPNDGYGCGYTDLPNVVTGLSKLGFHTGLWTENGVEKIAWEVGKAGTRVQKLDVAWTGEGHQFALDANKQASQGILDNSDSRPFVWTVMGWAGIQRYAVTWTGDQSGTWDYIRWHIPTLIGSGLSGMVYSTGDVDGIYGGSPETYTRDLQWKCFTPVLMGMSGWSKIERKHPWWFEEPYRSINRNYLKMKMRLMPYMYTLAREAEQSGAPIVRGIGWDYPNDRHATDNFVKYQFLLGRDLLVAPVFKSQGSSGGWRDSVYLPEGTWVDYWNGRVTRVGAEGLILDYPVTLDKLPIFVRGGGIIPMYPEALYDGQVAKDMLTLDLYPSGHSEYSLYEDDGNTRAYKNREFSTQRFSLSEDDGSGVTVTIDPVQGRFAGINEVRTYLLDVHSRNIPRSVTINGVKSAGLTQGEFGKGTVGWYYDGSDRNGVLHIKTEPVSVRTRHSITMSMATPALVVDATPYPTRPAGDGTISADQLIVVERPAEESGYPLENAFDGKPESWFRTVRNQSVSYGPHELVLAFKERKVIDGFQIAPRTDKWWKYGQVYKYELYVGEENGNWGSPVMRDTLALDSGMQTVHFTPTAGRLVRFRILSVHDTETDTIQHDSSSEAFSALTPSSVKPVTISEFHLLEHHVADSARVSTFLSEAGWSQAECAKGAVKSLSAFDHTADSELRMNGLKFRSGLSAVGESRIDYVLHGDWRRFRVEAGIDDRDGEKGTVRFQVYGNGRLLYQSAPVRSGEIAKIEIDVRGVTQLSLRTAGAGKKRVTDWANPVLSGVAGARVGERPE